MQLEDIVASRLDPAVFADKILELDMQWFHKEWLHSIQQHNRVLIVAPRGHGKCYCKGAQVQLSNGKSKKIEDCSPNDKTLSLAPDNKIVPSTITHIINNGTKDVYQITLASGRTTRVTKNHPFLTATGWQSIETGLQEKERIAIPKQIPHQHRN